MSKLSHRQAFAEGVHASIAILRSGIAFPVFLKPAAHPHTKKNQLAEAFIHRLAGEVVVVRVPLLDSTLCPQEAGVPQPVLEYAHAATGLSRMKATVLWAHVQNSDASAGVSRDQLYRRAVTIANRFPGYELASAVKKLRIKQTIVDAKIQACVLRIGDLTRHEQTMDVHTSTHQSSDAADKYAQDVTRRGDGLFFLERRRRAARTGYHYSAGYGDEITVLANRPIGDDCVSNTAPSGVFGGVGPAGVWLRQRRFARRCEAVSEAAHSMGLQVVAGIYEARAGRLTRCGATPP